MADGEPIAFRRPAVGPVETSGAARHGGAGGISGPGYSQAGREGSAVVAFNRTELNAILDVYGRRVAAGDWRDYAIDMGRESAVFSVFRRASEVPIYRIEKSPKLARRQGAYSVITATGLILKRGADLKRVIAVLEKGFRVVD